MSLQDAKAVVRAFHAAIDAAAPEDAAAAMAAHCAPNLHWRGYAPFYEIMSAEEVGTQFWQPLKASMTRLHHRLDILIAGENRVKDGTGIWVATMGHLMGLHDGAWLGIQPTRKIVMLRFSAFHRVEGDKIVETAMYFDIPHLMMQAGLTPFPPMTGAQLVQPGPATHDGLVYEPQDPEEGEKTLAAINSMIGDLKIWQKDEPITDELARSWVQDMIWWGPTGIGATFTIPRYAEQHAGAFRKAFKNRKFVGHVAKIAEGNYGGFFGWPNLSLEHAGGFMGMPGTGQWADMRVIDMYRRDGDKLAENWIFIDLLHFWKQQGVDILARTTGIATGD